MGIKSQGNPQSTYNAVWQKTAKGAVDAAMPLGIQATGGSKVSGSGYVTHTFTSPGNFVVSTVGNSPGAIEYAIVGGGGGGGS